MERVSFVWSYRRPKYGYFQVGKGEMVGGGQKMSLIYICIRDFVICVFLFFFLSLGPLSLSLIPTWSTLIPLKSEQEKRKKGKWKGRKKEKREI